MRNREKKPREKMPQGGRNLVLLGIVSTLIAVSTTGVSLAIYHKSGDIYLDRSRPGYLPDEEEIEDESEQKEEEYEFSKSGKLTEEDVAEFLDKLKTEVESITSYEKPFGEGMLSDERLGIPAEKSEDEVPAEI